MALIDSGFFPIPVSMDGVLIGYVASDHKKFLVYCLMASAASVVGSLVPYYVGRAGGELVLLKRINRQRYERMRDRFERQEFLAIMVPAMCPPPMPIKLFEFAAGVFEVPLHSYTAAITIARLLRYFVIGYLAIRFGEGAKTYMQQHWLQVTLLAVAVVTVSYVLSRVVLRRRTPSGNDT